MLRAKTEVRMIVPGAMGRPGNSAGDETAKVCQKLLSVLNRDQALTYLHATDIREQRLE